MVKQRFYFTEWVNSERNTDLETDGKTVALQESQSESKAYYQDHLYAVSSESLRFMLSHCFGEIQGPGR